MKPVRRPLRRVRRLDVLASVAARIAPRPLRPRIDQLRLDVGAILGSGAPMASTPGAPLPVPVPLSAIDPIEHTLPRRFRASYVTLRTDVRWLWRDVRGLPRPTVVERGPSRYDRPVAPPRAASPRSGLATREVEVVEVRAETADAITITVRELDGAPLAFEAGQFLTLHLVIDGRTIRRAYSLSSSPLDGPEATFTVKRVAGGLASNHLADHLTAGDRLRVLGPSGGFLAPPGDDARDLVMIAGGSGITPIAAILETVLRAQPARRVRLLYGSRDEASEIFGARLAALVEQHPDRLRIERVYGAALDGATIDRFLADADAASDAGWLSEGRPRDHYLCGPSGLMALVEARLEARGVSDVRIERFQSPDRAPAPRGSERPQTVRLTLHGRDHLVRVAPGQTILEAGVEAGVGLPFSCAMGGCAACKGRLVEGEVAMEEPNCLSPRERDEGFVLTCSSRPTGDAHIEIGEG